MDKTYTHTSSLRSSNIFTVRGPETTKSTTANPLLQCRPGLGGGGSVNGPGLGPPASGLCSPKT